MIEVRLTMCLERKRGGGGGGGVGREEKRKEMQRGRSFLPFCCPIEKKS